MTEKVVSSSPHIRAKNTTSGIMCDVLIALIPAVIAAVYYFGIRTLYFIAISTAFCVLFEYLWQKALKKPITTGDMTAVVTGVLLALNVPVTAPWWVLMVGAFVAIIIVKQFFGGTGQNFMNPALTARAFLLASWPVLMTSWVMPHTAGFLIESDVVTSATPLAMIKEGNIEMLPSLFDAFIGKIPGSIGETCVPALLLGFAYLLVRKVIKPTIPLSFLISLGVLTFFFPIEQMSPLNSALYSLCTGGVMLGAIFMATDYTTSPVTFKGQIIMGICCGVITFVIRKFGGYPEGATYAILIMNIATPLLDKYIKNNKFGKVKAKGGQANA